MARNHDESSTMLSAKEKHRIILNAEQQFAHALAKHVIDKPKISVWLILMPILFLYYAHNIQKYKSGIRAFAGGFLKTKSAALDWALHEFTERGPVTESMPDFLALNAGDSDKMRLVRLKQKAEIDILKNHYGQLLRSHGSDHDTLLRNAYTHGGEYRRFLNRLMKAEEEVNKAVLDAFHPSKEAREIVARMEAMAEKLRDDLLARLYG